MQPQETVIAMVGSTRIGPIGALALALACCLGALPPAGSSQAPVRGLGDPVFPALGNTGYDALQYDLAFDYRADTRKVEAVTTMAAQARQDLARFELDALGLDVHRVRVDGRVAGFALHDEKLVVTPARPVAPGATMTVQVEYTANPRAALPHTGWVPTADGFAVAGQPNSAHTVFPCNDHPSDKARFTVRVTAPSDRLGVANGSLADTTEHDGRTTRTYLSRDPMATELLQVSVGRYTVRQRPGPGGLPLRDVVPTARAGATEPALALTPGQLSWIEQRLGAFPLETYGLMPADTDAPEAFGFTGLETQTLTLYKPGFLLQPERSIGSHMMHELVHSWFGDSVTPKTWADLWLNEGHADLYGLMYRYDRGWPDSLGLTTLEARMKNTYAKGDQWRHDSGPVAAPNAANLFDSQRYVGGALVLYALREKVGGPTFDRIEQSFLQRYRDSTADTHDFIGTASAVAGQDLGGFLTDWLYGTKTPPMPNHPDWKVTPAAARARSAEGAPQGSATL
ncbi:M1 family metallopeptidase [Kitasatospora atroaurantiaca]|uniref:Aminopeptidase N n=1 Tax=Kitasatospora atroaurantiaca TaxID=285545 RepID=A0A561EIR9_9ACTN|nr:M1 family metallopeptidase [Kitasatospora atroaurantiaca]TWE15509.1 peptidase M1-like protein [Kitasatospora atroaurantiaca]